MKEKKRKGYFYEKEENAIVKYIHTEDEIEKNEIFDTILYPALKKMIESIIRRYKLFIPDEDFKENFNDTISYLLTKISHYRPEITSYDVIKSNKEIERHDFISMSVDEIRPKIRRATEEDPEFVVVYPIEEGADVPIYYKKTKHFYKAYSYCGTVCKNYLMYKSKQYKKKQLANTPYDNAAKDIIDNIKYSDIKPDNDDIAERLLSKITNEIRKMIDNPIVNKMTTNEIKVGKALISLMENWEEVLPNIGSNKLQKSSILYYLREEARMTTKEIRNNMRKYKIIYDIVKEIELNDLE